MWLYSNKIVLNETESIKLCTVTNYKNQMYTHTLVSHHIFLRWLKNILTYDFKKLLFILYRFRNLNKEFNIDTITFS